jgi:hypothetical protein
MKKVLLAGAAALALSGCATGAQMQMNRIITTQKSAFPAFKTCLETIRAKPEYAAVVRHLSDPPTTAQMTDGTLPTPEEARLFGMLHDEVTNCRSQLETALLPVRQDVVQMLGEIDTETRNNAIAFSEGKVTWGEQARRGAALNAAAKAKFLALSGQLDAELNAQHRAEVQTRAAAAAVVLGAAAAAAANAHQPAPAPIVQPVPVMPRSLNCISNGIGQFVYTNCN